MISIAKALISDLDKISELGPEFYKEGNMPTKYLPEVFKETWSKLIESKMGVIFVMQSNEENIGILGGVKYPDPNSNEIMASEFFWFVRKGYRGHGLKLLKEFEAWAKEQGATKVIMMHLATLMPEKIKKLYTRMGYEEIETHYLKEVR
jgi:GNAT superfamily N-acetyltransferase